VAKYKTVVDTLRTQLTEHMNDAAFKDQLSK
jgi:chromosome segregation ATPase